ncbi:MAG: sigma-70 family RNA polymerase sigma factor [Microscillaceae bacterium]
MRNESLLVEGCRKGKRRKQRELYEHYSPSMFVVALRYAPSRLDAEDILQEAFVKVFEHIGTFRGDCPLEFWIKRIVINTALNHNRRKQPAYSFQDVAEIENLVSDTEITLSNYNFTELLGFVQKLPERCRLVFNLYAIEGYGHREIAEMLEITEGTSKSQYARAKLLLQEMIKENERVSYADARGR